MKLPFRSFRGVAAPLPVANVNTDAIIPSDFLRSENADLALGLFSRWRFRADGSERPEFVLNKPAFRRAEILVAGENFGCGSSREAAAWALLRFGIRVVVAPSFADIFYENAFRNGLLAAIVDPHDLAMLVAALEAHPEDAAVEVDLANRTLVRGNAARASFQVPEFRRQALLNGEDEIAFTLREGETIARHVAADRARRPWLHRAMTKEAV